jgi:hypothetical protein
MPHNYFFVFSTMITNPRIVSPAANTISTGVGGLVDLTKLAHAETTPKAIKGTNTFFLLM